MTDYQFSSYHIFFLCTAAKSTIPGKATPNVHKTATKTPASKATRSVSHNNKNYISRVQLMNAATKCVDKKSKGMKCKSHYFQSQYTSDSQSCWWQSDRTWS